MPASFPGAIKSFSAITKGVTVLEQLLFDERGLEVEAIETELGALISGSSSLAERLLLAMDLDGNPSGFVQNFDATNGQRKRFRCGVTEVRIGDLTTSSISATGTITFAPALQVACHAFTALQLVESDIASNNIPSFIAYVDGSGTTTTFDFVIQDGAGTCPDLGTGCLIHWLAVEKDFTGTSLNF